VTICPTAPKEGRRRNSPVLHGRRIPKSRDLENQRGNTKPFRNKKRDHLCAVRSDKREEGNIDDGFRADSLVEPSMRGTGDQDEGAGSGSIGPSGYE